MYLRLTNDCREIELGGIPSELYPTVREWGLMRWDRDRRVMRGYATLELLGQLAALGRQLPEQVSVLRGELIARAALVDNERLKKDPEPLVLYPVRVPLYKHQVRGANMALYRMGVVPATRGRIPPGGGFGLLMDMGTGKSLTAIAIAGALRELDGLRRVLVVAPSSVCGVWPRELAEHAGYPHEAAIMTGTKAARLKALASLADTPADAVAVAVINYESVWRDGIFDALCDWRPDLVIADESQRIKTHDTAQSKAMHKLGDLARYRLILSGTPVQNSAIDLWSQFRFLDPSVFGVNFYAFKNFYAIMGGYEKKQIIGYRNIDDLVRREYSAAYRVTKEECLDLPEQTFENRYIELPADARKVYDRIRRESYAQLSADESVTTTTVLTKMLRLQQLTGGFLRTDDEVTHSNRAKLDALMEMVEDCRASGQKLVVFARFTAEIDLIGGELRKAGIRHAVIDGRTPTEPKVNQATGEPIPSRSELVADFQTNPDTLVFVAQIQTAGLGITLHTATLAVFYSMDFNYANYAQALARIHRIGQRRPCTYVHLIAEGTIDLKVLEAMRRKEDLAAKIVDNWREVFADPAAPKDGGKIRKGGKKTNDARDIDKD